MAKQPQDNVPTRRAESLSASYFDGSPSQASFEKVEERVLGGFGRYATLNADAKETAAQKYELKVKMTPWLKVLRTRLNAMANQALLNQLRFQHGVALRAQDWNTVATLANEISKLEKTQ